MQIFPLRKVLCAASFAAFVAGAQATPITFDFKSADPLNSGGAMSVSGVTVSVSAGTVHTTPGNVTELGGTSVTEDATYGLGVSTGQSGLDGTQSGQTKNEDYLVFSFASAVSLDKIAFSEVSSTDLVSIAYLSGGNWVYLPAFYLPSGITFDNYDLTPDLVSTSFRIAALRGDGNDSHFRVAGLTLNASSTDSRDVPEPASLALVAAGLVGLAAARRKR